MECGICGEQIKQARATFPCKHSIHLICCLEGRLHMCPVCTEPDANVVNLGLGSSNATIASLLLKTVKPVKTAWGVFKRKTTFADLLREHPSALLATHHAIDFVQGKAKLADMTATYELETLLRHEFTMQHLDAMASDKADTLRCLYRAYGTAACNKAFGIDRLEINDRCRDLPSLMALGMSVEDINSAGLGLDSFLKRGATLGDLLTVPLYNDMESRDSSFAEFSTAWSPTQAQLVQMGCTEQDLVEELTDWDFHSIPQAAEPKPIKASRSFSGLKLNF